MSGPHFDQLKQLGYLSSPVSRIIWRFWSPDSRRQTQLLLLFCLAWSSLLACTVSFLAFVPMPARLPLFVFYGIGFLLVFLTLYSLQRALLKIKPFKVWVAKKGIGFWDWFWTCLAMFVLLAWLADALQAQLPLARWLFLLLLLLGSYLLGQSLKALVLKDLYWFGLTPTPLKHHPILYALSLVLIFIMGYLQASVADFQADLPQKPTLILCFDLQESEPFWQGTTFTSASDQWTGDDIARFWMDMATGVSSNQHGGSLFGFSVMSRGPFSPFDSVANPFLYFSKKFGLAQRNGIGTRFRPFFWEILDQHGAITSVYGFWNSFPARALAGRVMSEQWRFDAHLPPYSAGLSQLAKTSLPFDLNTDLVQPFWEREWAQWTYLENEMSSLPSLSLHYFPLEDMLLHVDGGETDLEKIRHFRRQKMQALLENLPGDTRLLIVLTSGRNHPDKVHYQILSNTVDSPQRAQHLAPHMLNLFGLPLDRDMASGLFPEAMRHAYRYRPGITYTPDIQPKAFLEELESLGYVR